MNELESKYELINKRENVKSFDDLVAFLEDVKNNYNIDYGVAPRAMAQASLAVSWYLADEFGITGFQSGFVMWDFIRGWEYTSNKAGLKIIDYDNMLYPQYNETFEKTITSDTWNSLQNQAEAKLITNDHAADRVKQHWRSIVDGVVPFGYTVKEE